MTDADAVILEARINEFASLTPMQQLVLENLGSRLRLGHSVWTFTSSSALSRTLKTLEARGYVVHISGVVQGTVRASLTEAGQWLILDPAYVPPLATVPSTAQRGEEPRQ